MLRNDDTAMIRPITLVGALLALVVSAGAHAGSPRTFVASSGADTNVCSFSAPCRSFGAAIAQTTPGGEVLVLDSAGYGPVTISQAVSIVAPSGIYAGISVLGGSAPTIGINVTAPAGALVMLRGLAINKVGSGGTTGIRFGSGGGLIVDRCIITGFPTGISHSASGNLSVLDTQIRDGSMGIQTGIASGTSAFLVERSTIENMTGAGVEADDNSVGIVNNSMLSNIRSATVNGVGILAVALSGNSAVTVNRTAITRSDLGVGAFGFPGGFQATATASRTVVTDSGAGFISINGFGTGIGIMYSYQDNMEDGNGTPSSTPVLRSFY